MDGIFVAPGEEWRKRRRALSPAFSGHKLKLVSNCESIMGVNFFNDIIIINVTIINFCNCRAITK